MRKHVGWVAGLGALLLAMSGCSSSSGAAGPSGGNLVTGGAQDIGYFREILDEGGIPGPNTLDANGFFNEHYTVLPEPACGEKVCVQAMLAVMRNWVDEEPERVIQIGLNSPIDPKSLVRPATDMVLVVDVSGSMGDAGKLDYVKQGLHILLDELEPGDRVGLVTYETEVHVLATLEGEASREELHGLVDSLLPGGTTNLYGGLETGLAMAARASDPERQSRVVLLSDGLPTAGNTDPEAIRSMAESYVLEGVGLTTIGVGQSFDVDLMRSLAERGAGNFYYVEDPQAVQEVFAEELDYFLTPIALDLTIQLRSGSAYRLKNVTGAVNWRVEDFGGSIWIPAVFLASRTEDATDATPMGRRGGGSSFFVETEPASGTDSPLAEMVEVVLTYRDAETGEEHTQSILVRAPEEAEALAYYSEDPMIKNAAVYQIYKGLHRACEVAGESYDRARQVLEALRRHVVAYLEAHPEDEDVAADLELIERFLENLSRNGTYWGEETGQDPVMDEPVMFCNTAGGAAAWHWLLWVGLAFLAFKRRRARSS